MKNKIIFVVVVVCWIGVTEGTLYINEGDSYPSVSVWGGVVIMNGGIIAGNLQLYGSHAEIYGGYIGNFLVLDNNEWHGDIISKVSMYGGHIVSGISAPDLGGEFSWYGGTIAGEIRSGWKNEPSYCYHRIYGYDFKLNGQEPTEFILNPGYSQNQLTGYLQDGTPINNRLVIYGGSKIELVVIPEPATLLLLGFGAVMLRRKRQQF